MDDTLEELRLLREKANNLKNFSRPNISKDQQNSEVKNENKIDKCSKDQVRLNPGKGKRKENTKTNIDGAKKPRCNYRKKINSDLKSDSDNVTKENNNGVSSSKEKEKFDPGKYYFSNKGKNFDLKFGNKEDSRDKVPPVSKFKEKVPPVPKFEEKAPPASKFEERVPPVPKSEQKGPPVSKFENKVAPVSRYEDKAPPASIFEEKAPPVSKFKDAAPPLSKFEEKVPPVSKFEEKIPKVSKFKDTASPVSKFEEKVPPVCKFEEKIPKVSKFKDTAPSLSKFEEKVPSVSRFEEKIPKVSKFKDTAPPVSKFEEKVPSVSKFEEKVPKVSKFKDTAPPVSKFEEQVPKVSKFKDTAPPVSKFEEKVPKVSKFEEKAPPVPKFEEPVPPVSKYEDKVPPVSKFEEKDETKPKGDAKQEDDIDMNSLEELRSLWEKANKLKKYGIYGGEYVSNSQQKMEAEKENNTSKNSKTRVPPDDAGNLKNSSNFRKKTPLGDSNIKAAQETKDSDRNATKQNKNGVKTRNCSTKGISTGVKIKNNKAREKVSETRVSDDLGENNVEDLPKENAEVTGDEQKKDFSDNMDTFNDSIINDRENIKETDEYKRAQEEEWVARQEALRLQAVEAQKMRRELKRKKTERLRELDMKKRQKQRVEEVRKTQKKDEEDMNMKVKLRAEVRMELQQLENKCFDMASILRGLGVLVSSGQNPNRDEIRAAYKKALLSFHPDRAPVSDIRKLVEAEEKFKLISRMRERFSYTFV